ncbi:MAG: DEAD/DEAH box helicase [Pseudomonadales bacterium]|nr:DEAD/DEAH box helicase [Pseudomonadales bacterium]
MFTELNLHEKLLHALQKLGFDKPTEVQQKSLPLALAGKDLIVQAATGSGKTVAFALPVLQRLLENKGPAQGTRALILSPTRELARQLARDFTALSRFTGFHNAVICGGQEFKVQRAFFRKDPEIIVATPGRLLEHIQQQTPLLDQLEVLVLDEADRLLEMGMLEDVLEIVAHCNPLRQTLLFSATMPPPVKQLAGKIQQAPEEVLLHNRQQHVAIRQQYVLADDDRHKEKLLLWLLQNETFQQAVVFTNTRERANQLCGVLRYRGVKSDFLHGELKQDKRNATLAAFRESRFQVLVASDLAARGLDIKGIELVINFDMARKGDDYVHRIGRTGRAGNNGLAIALIAPEEWNLKASIERYLAVSMERRSIKAVPGLYKGPGKLKNSGKAVGLRNKGKSKIRSKNKSGVK